MAAPETDVPNLLGEKSTPAKLEELSREVGHTLKIFFTELKSHERFKRTIT